MIKKIDEYKSILLIRYKTPFFLFIQLIAKYLAT